MFTDYRLQHRDTGGTEECVVYINKDRLRKTFFDILHESTATICIENTSITRPQSVESLARRYEKDKRVCEYLGFLFLDKFPYDEDDFNRYAYGRCLLKAYYYGDFKSANKYAGLNPTGVSYLRVICAKCWLLFKGACLLRDLKDKVKVGSKARYLIFFHEIVVVL